MTDRENVIESLRNALARVQYGDMDNVTLSEVEEAIVSAIDLLRCQEPMKPGEVFQDGSYYASCGDCGYPLTELTRQHGWPRYDWPPFCSNCGRQVKWDG